MFVELPAQSDMDTISTAWPPINRDWNAIEHPCLASLPNLAIAITDPRRFVGIKADLPFIIDNKARFVAACFQTVATSVQNLLTTVLPEENDALKGVLTDEMCIQLLDHSLFTYYNIQPLKRVRRLLIELLYSRFKQLKKIQTGIFVEAETQPEEQFFSYPANRLTAFFELFVYEAVRFADSPHSLSDLAVFTILPSWDTRESIIPVEAELDFLLYARNQHDREFLRLRAAYPFLKCLVADKEIDFARIRALLAPVFGMRDTGAMCRNLRDAGHIITTDSLCQLLYLQLRRSVSSSILYEGETGCGKTANIKLYSHLINANTTLFTNMKLHLIAVIKVIVTNAMSAISILRDANSDQEEWYELNKLSDYIQHDLSLECSIDELLDIFFKLVQQSNFGSRKSLNEIATQVCAYFYLLLDSYPLHREGLSEPLANHFYRFGCWISQSAQQSKRLKGLVSSVVDQSPFLAKEGHVNRLSEADAWPAPTLFSRALEQEPLVIDEFNLCSDAKELKEFLHQLATSAPVSLYRRVLADEGLTAEKWRELMRSVVESSRRIKALCNKAVVCVFVDETNTAGCLGLVSEAFVSHSMDGIALPSNMLFVGAINPYRKSAADSTAMDFTSSNIPKPQFAAEDELAEAPDDYLASTPYIVKLVPPSLGQLLIHYPNQDLAAERSFMEEYFYAHVIINVPAGIDRDYWYAMLDVHGYYKKASKLIIAAQNLVKGFHIPRVYMSMRNLIRCTQLLSWYLTFTVPTFVDSHGTPRSFVNIFLPRHHPVEGKGNPDPTEHMIADYKRLMNDALVMALSVTYLFQLPNQGHVIAGKAKQNYSNMFLTQMASLLESGRVIDLTREPNDYDMQRNDRWVGVIRGSLEHLWSQAKIANGLAKTHSLLTSFYMNVLVAETKMALLVTGPPGCGK